MTTRHTKAGAGWILLLLAVACLLPRGASGQTPYAVYDLGALGADTSSWGAGINNAGTVVGTSGDSDANFHAFSWTISGGIRDLGNLGGNRTNANAINDSGYVIGSSISVAAGGYWHAFLYIRGAMIDLGTLGGTYSWGYDINNSLWMVGDSRVAGGTGVVRPFIRKPGVPNTDLGTLPGHTYGYARGINNLGVVVGESAPPALTQTHAVMWDANDAIIDIGCFGPITEARDINDLGQVVGNWQQASGGNVAYLWTLEGGRTDLPSLGNYTAAYAINNRGEVVGESGTRDTSAFIWDPVGGMRNLNDLLPANSGWTLSSANDINDNGWIVGSGLNPAGQYHGFLLIPEPATVALLALAGLALARRRR